MSCLHKYTHSKSPDPKTMQINLQGFLDKNSQVFVLELWKLLISAQNSLGGIPQQFLDHTKEELLQRKVSCHRYTHLPMGAMKDLLLKLFGTYNAISYLPPLSTARQRG